MPNTQKRLIEGEDYVKKVKKSKKDKVAAVVNDPEATAAVLASLMQSKTLPTPLTVAQGGSIIGDCPDGSPNSPTSSGTTIPSVEISSEDFTSPNALAASTEGSSSQNELTGFVEKLNDYTTMLIEDEDLFISQMHDNTRAAKLRTLRLTLTNAKMLMEVWRQLTDTSHEAIRDKVVSADYTIGDRLHVGCNNDFPYIAFRRWRRPNARGEVFPGDHGFTLKPEDYSLFEKNVRYFTTL